MRSGPIDDSISANALSDDPKDVLSANDDIDALTALMRRRRGPEFCILDQQLALVYACPAATAAYTDANFLSLVRQMIAGLKDTGVVSDAPIWEQYREGLFIRVIPLNGPGLEHVAVFFERSRESATVASAALRFRLSKREAEVLALLMRGYDTKLIAAKLSIAPVTARDHIMKIMQKSHSRRRMELISLITRGT